MTDPEYSIFNGGFEGSNPGESDNILSWRQTTTGEVFTEISVPYGWTAAWDRALGRPEMQVIEAVAPYLDPLRVFEGNFALKWFNQFRTHDTSVYQSMVVPTGSIVTLSGLANAWYSQKDTASLSQYVKDGKTLTIHDGDPGYDLMLGIDPTGGIDPWADSVVWQKANIYQGADEIKVTALAKRPVVTLFLRGKNEFAFKHCDVYWDDIRVDVKIPDPPPPTPPDPHTCPVPREDYVRNVLVLPQAATKEQMLMAACWAYAHDKMSLEFSVDDAMYGPNLTSVTAHLAWFTPTSWNRPEIIAFRNAWYPNAKLDDVYFYDVPETPEPPVIPVDPPKPPAPAWIPERWIPKGSAGGFGSDGDRGQSDLARLCMAGGAVLPTTKFVVDVGPSELIFTTSPQTPQVLRKIDLPGVGNIETFNASQDPDWQANVRMNVLLPFMLKHKRAGVKGPWWEIVNEQAPDSPSGWAAFARFFMVAMDIADANGVKLACFSTSTGEPKIGATLPDGSKEYDAWAAVAATGVFERMVRTPDGIPHGIAGHAYQLVGDTYQLFRHRYLYETYIIPRMKKIGVTRIPPFFMTEYGLPDTHMHYGPDYLWQQFVAFDREFRKDFYVAGFHAYINGYDKNYDLEYIELYPRFVQYVIAQKDVVNG